MEIFGTFGLDPILLGAQIINFLIVFIILKKVLYKPFLTTLKKREETIKDGLKSAEEGRRILEEAEEKEKQMLKKAQETADRIMSDAKNQATELSKEIEESSRIQSEKILAQASEKIETETKEAEERLKKEIGQVALTILEKTLPAILDKKQQEEVLKKAAANIK